MLGKLIIPFHFHFQLTCRPYTPNLTTAFNTSQKRERESEKKQKYKSLTLKVMEPDHESLLTVNLNKEPFPFITLLHFFFFFKCVPQRTFPSTAEQQSSLSISHHVLLHQTAKINTLINRIH